MVHPLNRHAIKHIDPSLGEIFGEHSAILARDSPEAMAEALTLRDRDTPQGGSAVSPVLANLFLHYAFDAWMARTFPSVKDGNRRGAYQHTSFAFPGYTFRARSARARGGNIFTAFLPTVSKAS